MFSKACEYALRAMMFIAQRSDKGYKVGIKEIAKQTQTPEHFIGKILQLLCQKGLLQSAKGPNGGFFIDELTKNKTVADIVTAIDGNKLFIGCGMGLKNCSEKKPCPLHDEFKIIRKNIFDMLQTKTVGEFNHELTSGVRYLKR